MMAVICPVEGTQTQRYTKLIENILKNADDIYKNIHKTEEVEILRDRTDFADWCQNKKRNGDCVIFAVHLDRSGINLLLYSVLKEMDMHTNCLCGCTGAIVVDGENELYTKNIAKKIAFSLSRAGCMLPGHTFAEATGSLKNQRKNADHRNMSLQEAFFANVKEAAEHAMLYSERKQKSTGRKDKIKKLLCIYAGNKGRSNTYLFWKYVRANLAGQNIDVTEINLRNGEIADCMGCPFEVCLHYSEKGSCFYGGVIVEQVYPALMESDALMILSPNYNDSLSANIQAFINRLTALYRKVDFQEKQLFSIIVSGYSGSDILAEQIISSLHFNKGFALPANAIKMLTANDPGEILTCENVKDEAQSYAQLIAASIKGR